MMITKIKDYKNQNQLLKSIFNKYKIANYKLHNKTNITEEEAEQIFIFINNIRISFFSLRNSEYSLMMNEFFDPHKKSTKDLYISKSQYYYLMRNLFEKLIFLLKYV